jgi:hypothetical protein
MEISPPEQRMCHGHVNFNSRKLLELSGIHQSIEFPQQLPVFGQVVGVNWTGCKASGADRAAAQACGS